MLYNLIRTLLIIAVIYYGFRFITRFLFPWLVKIFIKKVNKKFGQNSSHQQKSRSFEEKKQGDVTIRYKKDPSSRQTKKDFNEGDYVDFERGGLKHFFII